MGAVADNLTRRGRNDSSAQGNAGNALGLWRLDILQAGL